MMTSSNKARRYLQHHKQHFLDTQNNHQSAAELLVIDPTLAATSMRKFRARNQQQQQASPPVTATVAIPQICVDNDDDAEQKSNDDENGHVAILDAFDQVLENELKRTSVLRTSSLKQKEVNSPMGIPVSQQRSFSFALGSSTNLDGEKHLDDDDEPTNIAKMTKIPSTIKASLSKETFSRLFHSLAFRAGNHSTSKLTLSTPDAEPQQQQQQQQQTCLACQNQSNLDLLPKHKKRPSIFGVLVSKLNTTTINNENPPQRCPVCKRRLSKSIFYPANAPDDPPGTSPSTQTFSSASLTSSKLLQEQGQVLLRTKRRRSLPSLFHSLFDFDHQEKRRLENTSITHRPSFSSIMTQTLIDSITREQQPAIPTIRQISPISYSSISLAGSDDSNEEHSQGKSFRQRLTSHQDSSQLTEKVSK